MMNERGLYEAEGIEKIFTKGREDVSSNSPIVVIIKVSLPSLLIMNVGDIHLKFFTSGAGVCKVRCHTCRLLHGTHPIGGRTRTDLQASMRRWEHADRTQLLESLSTTVPAGGRGVLRYLQTSA